MSSTPLSTVTHLVGDLFAAPRNSILVHACNAQGSWGGGIAVEFHNRFPAAFQTYRAHCLAHDADTIMGTCLLIPGAEDSNDVACLFTSRRYGARKDKPTDILRATEAALQDLVKKNIGDKELHACKFNSGKFGVPWADTEALRLLWMRLRRPLVAKRLPPLPGVAVVLAAVLVDVGEALVK
ncbi:hypothetical protein EXIGLDRAFT_841234 [Exidia glandulosa HHB12029]|uniref:ADP-ribose 1''-phosphate phosphatase n=1 Tax=Exidia glandulosa HHB12029 TaxID=1314781 RepID=A0A165E030_EXIGL|nr:hypothetical protein EXIGLDRAFT_841234 [Exidia glandulosa HHB12029]